MHITNNEYIDFRIYQQSDHNLTCMKEGSWPTCRLFRWPNFFPLSQIWNDSRLLRSIIFCRPHRVIGRQTLSESVKLATERPLFHQSTSHQYLSRKYLKYDTWYKIYYVAIKLPLFNTYHTRLLINLLWSSHFRKLQKTAPLKKLFTTTNCQVCHQFPLKHLAAHCTDGESKGRPRVTSWHSPDLYLLYLSQMTLASLAHCYAIFLCSWDVEIYMTV